MFGKIVTICMFVVLASTLVSSQSQCGVCMPNFAQCINETSYRLCYEATTMEPVDDEVYTCKSNEYCTDSENICEANPDGVNIIAVCAAQQSSATCSTCTGKTNGQLVCLSTTEFGICRGTTTVESTNPLPCPTDQLCSEELVSQYNLKKVCAPQAVLDYFEISATCANEDAVTQATTKATTAAIDTISLCESSGKTGSYFQIANAENCQTYIYCQRDGNSFISMVMQCRAAMFYSVAQNKCISAVQCPQ
nr:uncharacterized protein LOC106623971 [Bactrocera oleae]